MATSSEELGTTGNESKDEVEGRIQEEPIGRYHPSELLHHYAWLDVFEYLDLTDPRQLINLCEAHPHFDQLLENLKLDGKNSGKNACALEEVLPLILKWLDQSTLLNQRLVCKRSKNVVDTIVNESKRISAYENLGLFPRLMTHFPLDSLSPYQRSYEYRCLKLHYLIMHNQMLDSVPGIENFERDLKMAYATTATGIDLLFGKELCIFEGSSRQEIEENNEKFGYDEEYEDYGGQRTFIDRAVQLCNSFHNKIRYLQYFMSAAPLYTDHYDLIQRTLASLPNLRQFEIYYRTLNEEEEGPRRLQFSPLPSAPNLEHLKFSNCSMPEAFVEQLAIRYGDHLKEIKLTVAADDAFELDDREPEWFRLTRQTYNFTKLLELQLDLDEEVPVPVTFMLKIVAPQLMHLRLSFASDDMPLVHQLIEIAAHFQSITSLELSFFADFGRNGAPMELLENRRVQHLNTRKLELVGTVTHSHIPIRFYTRLFPNLELLDVSNSSLVNNRLEAQYRDPDSILLENQRFHESNIWREAEHLKMVRLSEIDDVYRNDIYVCPRPEVAPVPEVREE